MFTENQHSSDLGEGSIRESGCFEIFVHPLAAIDLHYIQEPLPFFCNRWIPSWRRKHVASEDWRGCYSPKFQSCKHNLRCTIAKYSSAHNSHFSYTAVTYSAFTCTLHSYWMISLFLTWSCNAEQLEPLEVTWHLCSRLTLRPHHASTGMYSFCLKSRSFLKCGFWQNWRTEVLQSPNPVSIIIRCPIQNLGWDATQQQDRLGFVGKNSSSRNVVPDLPFLFFRLFCFASIFWICFKGGDKVVGCLSLLQSS